MWKYYVKESLQTPSNKGAYKSPKTSNGGQVSKRKCQSVWGKLLLYNSFALNLNINVKMPKYIPRMPVSPEWNSCHFSFGELLIG